MKKRLLSLAVLAVLAGGPTHGEPSGFWFTLAGKPGEDGSDYIQIDPTSVRMEGSYRDLKLRVSRGAVRTSTDGVQFRSFEGAARIDCMAQTAMFTHATFFPVPHFSGAPVSTLTYAKDVPRPVAFRQFEGDYSKRVIAAACAVGQSSQPR